MKPLFFLYVWLNLTRIAGLRKEDLVEHIRKKQFRRVDYFFRLPLGSYFYILIKIQYVFLFYY